jgi:succinate dehydrogenase / fumarate reductase cytochrome b subunit
MDERRTFSKVNRDTDVWPGKYRLGMVAFMGQRLSGLGIVVYLFMHVFIISSAIWHPDGGSFNRILQHLQQPQFIVGDLVLLAAVMFHAFNGFRILLLDVGIGVRRHKPVFWALMIVTAALVIYGIVVAVPFILGASLSEPRVI